MAETVGLAASVFQIANVGFNVAKGLHSIADDIGSAGREVRAYADEISGFSKLLDRVRTEVLHTPGMDQDEHSMLKDVLDICDRVLKPFSQLQDMLKPLLVHYGTSPGKLKQLGLRIYYIFSCRRELLFYRDLVKAQHRMLDTIMTAIMLRLTNHKAPQSIHILQIYLKSSVLGIQYTFKPSRDLNRRAIESGAQSTGVGNTSDELVSARPETGNHDREFLINKHIGGGQLSICQDDRKTTDGLSNNEVQALDHMIQQSLNPDAGDSAQETLEDAQILSRKVLLHASAVLRTSYEVIKPTREDDFKVPFIHEKEERCNIDEMQENDPLATQIWKLYLKARYQLPNAARMENLTWRMMTVTMKRAELNRN